MSIRKQLSRILSGLDSSLRLGQLGQSLVIVAFAMIGLLGFIGFAVDTGSLYLHRIWLGQAVDAAALAAGVELPNVKAACARAVDYLRVNDYVAGSDFSYSIVFTSEPDAPGGDPGEFVVNSVTDSISTPEDCSSVTVPAIHENVHYHLRIIGDQEVPVILMGLFGFDSVGVGLPATAVRTARYDVVLVLDKSVSMHYDTCAWHRPADEYACQNRYTDCTGFYSEDFNAYNDTGDMIAAGWNINDEDAVTVTSGARLGTKGVRVTKANGNYALFDRNVDTTGFENVAVTFWARNENFGGNERVEVYWRPDSSTGWNLTLKMTGNNLTNDWAQYSVLLPSGAWNNPDLEIRIRGKGSSSKSALIDDLEMVNCTETIGPWLWYKPGGGGCTNSRPQTCADEAPQTLIPAVSPASNLPQAQLMQQPMLDVIIAADTFIDILDSRRLPGQPREDMIGLAVYNALGSSLISITTDYESIKDALYTQISATSNTNIGGGIRVGLDMLADARPNSIHIIALVTDGWPNRYDDPYVNPTTFGVGCPGYGVCTETLEFIDAQIGEALSQNVTIFSIALGEDLNTLTFDASSAYGPGTENFSGMDLMTRISEGTGGSAYHAPTSEELVQIFEWIAGAIFVRLTY